MSLFFLPNVQTVVPDICFYTVRKHITDSFSRLNPLAQFFAGYVKIRSFQSVDSAMVFVLQIGDLRVDFFLIIGIPHSGQKNGLPADQLRMLPGFEFNQ